MKKLLSLLLAIAVTGCNTTDNTSHNMDKVIENTAENTYRSVKPVQVKAGQLPSSVRFQGSVADAWQWVDKSGDNLLILTGTEEADQDTGRGIGLFAFHFIKDGNKDYKLLWKIADGIKDCPVDIMAAFIKPATSITDLDSNGVAETLVMYRLACRGDVSPSALKLIMHEGNKKYALRGSSWIFSETGEGFPLKERDELNLEDLERPGDEYAQSIQSMGRYENERDFDKAPPAFLQYAKKRWLKFADETGNN